jgi:predicted aspartyl protease
MVRTAACPLPLLFLMIGLHLTPIGLIDASANANVPLRMLNGNLPVVSVSINGRAPVEFVVDTGTNTTLVDPGLALRFQLTPAGTKILATLSGPVNTSRFVFDTIRIGGAVRSRSEALAQPMTQLQHLDPHIQGIIGWDFLRAFSFRIDYRRSRLELYADATDELPKITGGVRLPLQIVNDHILVRATSTDAEQGELRLALDSGISELLIFQNRLAFWGPPFSSRPNFFHAPPNTFAGQSTRRIATNHSIITAPTITLNDLSVGDLNFQRVSAVILAAPPATLSASEDGLLPTCIFASVFIDLSNATVILNPD